MKTVENIKNSGFTLIELLLVVALMAISVGVTSDILVSLVRGYNKSTVLNEVEQNANFVSQKLSKELRNAAEITYLDTGGSSPPTEGASFNEITFLDKQGNTVNYEVDSGVIYRDFNSAGRQPLTSDVAPTGVNVSCITGNACFTLLENNPQVVQISISLAQAGSSVVFEGDITIEDTVVIRDTY